MANDKYIIGLFDHEDKLINAVRSFKKEGIEINNALTPFPVHGLEKELGYGDSRLHTAGFLFGITGTTLALFMMSWVSLSSYPLNVGGKPFFALPAFIPITFELTVLFAAVGMVMVYLKRNQLAPGHVPRIFDDRITDDRFALVFDVNDSTTKADVDAITSLLKSSDVTEIKMKEFEENGEMFSSIEREFNFEGTADAPKMETVAQVVKESTIKKVEEKSVARIVKEHVAQANTKSVATKSDAELKSQLMKEIGIVSEADKDDLKRIKGIGKVYEGRLNEIGIYTFAQIAKLKGTGVESIEALTGFPGRIQREDWIGQAQLLKDGGSTEFSGRVDKGNVY